MAPMLNEAGHIEGLVADLAAQDWAGELEVLVADGGWTARSSACRWPRSATAWR